MSETQAETEARAFVREHPDTVRKWLAEDRAANRSASASHRLSERQTAIIRLVREHPGELTATGVFNVVGGFNVETRDLIKSLRKQGALAGVGGTKAPRLVVVETHPLAQAVK